MSLRENYTCEFYMGGVPALIEDEVVQLFIGQQNPNEKVDIAVNFPAALQRQVARNIATKRKRPRIEDDLGISALEEAQGGLQSGWLPRTPPNNKCLLRASDSDMSDSQQLPEPLHTPCVLLKKRFRDRKKIKYTYY